MENRHGLDALKEALKFERDGRKFFLEAKERTRQKYGQLMFQTVADAELDHMKRIKDIHDQLEKTGKWPERQSVLTPKTPVKNIFEQAREKLEGKVSAETDDLEAVKLAKEYEEKGIGFYRDLSDKAKGPFEKRFYKQLENEERGHFLIFQDMHEYFSDPTHWFSRKESLHWDGA